MKLKALLHVHTDDDPQDYLSYSFYEVIDRCRDHHFDVVALTCHNRVVDKKEYRHYAEQHGILLLPGIERSIEGKHVLLLNVDATAENIATFSDLERYKDSHPHILIIAPHPYIAFWGSLRSRLEKYHALFDALEIHWFYSLHYNPNRKVKSIARQFHIPLIGSSDVHTLQYMFSTYSIIDAKEKTAASVIGAIKKGAVKVVTKPHFFPKLVIYFLTMMARQTINLFRRYGCR